MTDIRARAGTRIMTTDSTQEHVSCWRCGYTVPLETIAISSWRKNDIGWECDCCVAKPERITLDERSEK